MLNQTLQAIEYFLEHDADAKLDLYSLQNLLFLADWKTAIENRETYSTFTGLLWKAHESGPFAEHLKSEILKSSYLKLEEDKIVTFKPNKIASKNLKSNINELTLGVVQSTRDKNGDSFILKLVNSIYPMRRTNTGDGINLTDAAQKWVEQIRPKLSA